MSRAVLTVAWCAVLSGCAALESQTGGASAVSARPRTEATNPANAAPPAATGKPPSPAFIEERAQQAYATGRLDVAEGYYLQLTRMKPNDAQPWFQLGNLYAEQGRLDAAERAYREALRRRNDARTLHNLGLVQVKLGVGALREARERLPADDPLHQETREFLQTLLGTAAQ